MAPIRLVLSLMAALAGCHDEVDPWRELVADHVTTTGRISHLECNEPASMTYSFTAGARTHSAEAPGDEFDCAKARIGDPVLVYYAPLSPEISTLLPPAQAYARTRTPPATGWLALAGAAGIALSIVAKLRATRRPA